VGPEWSVIYRDERILAVHKPAGIHVHPSAFDRGEPSLVDAIQADLGIKPYPVHRLDRPTSGLLIFALDPASAAFLGAAFREHRVEKTYWAVVRGWMGEAHATFEVQLDAKLPGRTDAETWFRPLEAFEAPWPRRGFPTATSDPPALRRPAPSHLGRHGLGRHGAQRLVGDGAGCPGPGAGRAAPVVPQPRHPPPRRSHHGPEGPLVAGRTGPARLVPQSRYFPGPLIFVRS